jgi:pimeloyl-ACP methyl ester carboxylesterase
MAGAGQDTAQTLRGLRQMAKAREPEPLGPRLGQVRCPVWLVVGEPGAARGVTDADIRLLADGLDTFRIETVRNAGHFLFEEDPRAVAAAVDHALASTRPLPLRAAGPGR